MCSVGFGVQVGFGCACGRNDIVGVVRSGQPFLNFELGPWLLGPVSAQIVWTAARLSQLLLCRVSHKAACLSQLVLCTATVQGSS